MTAEVNPSANALTAEDMTTGKKFVLVSDYYGIVDCTVVVAPYRHYRYGQCVEIKGKGVPALWCLPDLGLEPYETGSLPWSPANHCVDLANADPLPAVTPGAGLNELRQELAFFA